jgi:NADPH:quinone reductase-like Zn-dependent oxidoreductase
VHQDSDVRAAGITTLGGPIEVLALDELPQPAREEVLITVRAAGVGNWDELVRIGSWQVGGPPPMALGVEAAGTIAAVGAAVTQLVPGDDVLTHPLPLKRNGTWAEQVVAPSAVVAPKPRAVSWETAAAFPVPALTAIQVVEEALATERGEWVLVNGAGGVTGGLIAQLAAANGARVIATASAANTERLLQYGVREVLDYHDEGWPDLAREITGGEGVAKTANAARGGAGTALRSVADGGRLATITGDPPDADRGVTVSDVYVRPDGEQLSRLAQLLGDGTLTLDVAAVHPLEAAAAALRDATSGHAPGAVVLEPQLSP